MKAGELKRTQLTNTKYYAEQVGGFICKFHGFYTLRMLVS